MPISQATILSIYGSLCDLVDSIDVINSLGLQPDLFEGAESAQARLVQCIVAAHRLAHASQRAAIAEIMRDDREVQIDPITGRAG